MNHSAPRIVALVVAVSLSGAAELALTLFGADESLCEGDCDCPRSFGDRQCPPNCTQGTCAKVFPALAAVVALGPVRPPSAQRVDGERSGPCAEPLLDGVFHPPRL